MMDDLNIFKPVYEDEAPPFIDWTTLVLPTQPVDFFITEHAPDDGRSVYYLNGRALGVLGTCPQRFYYTHEHSSLCNYPVSCQWASELSGGGLSHQMV